MSEETYDTNREGRGGDLVLAQGEMALVKDGAMGNVDVVVGPFLHSLAKSDNPVSFNINSGRFERCTPEGAVQAWPVAKEGQYIILESPVEDDSETHPMKGKIKAQELDTGRRINIPGPATFALFPGQSTLTVDGHILRTNQYLIARVINGEAAMENWAEAVLKPQAQTEKSSKKPKEPLKAIEEIRPDEKAPHLVTGQLLIIKGTEVSFYIPPTGIEVIAEQSGYIRDAVTLEQLEYCILLDEKGTKEYVYGPAVVFPKSTQSFYTDSRGPEINRKFRAIELNDLMGVYLKVIRPYEENGQKHKEGDELFITGKEYRIYWPRVEHSIIKYGDRDMHYAVAIPKGEARYVLDRSSGEVKLVEGPKMFLPDPRREVIVRRVLPTSLVNLLYPGNAEALAHNSSLVSRGEGRELGQLFEEPTASLVSAVSFAGDEFKRETSFTPPRTIQLDTKYDGAVRVMVWTGYAMKIVSTTGKNRVVLGPATTFLGYDEVPEIFELSTGTPKSDDNSIRDVYLRVKANKVSDMIQAETLDYVQLQIPISYRVSFKGDQEKWFDVENYVKFLTDHLRSLVANAVKQQGIEKFSSEYIDILRDSILGVGMPAKKGRPGRTFEENGMCIYDVELGRMTIGDDEIGDLLQDSQHESVRQALALTTARSEVEVTEEKQKISRRTIRAKAKTACIEIDIEEEEFKKNAVLEDLKLKTELAEEHINTQIHGLGLNRRKAEELQEQEHTMAMVLVGIEEVTKKAEAITPDMVEAVQIFADKELAGKLAESMSPLAILGGGSLVDVFTRLIKGTPLAEHAKEILEGRKSRKRKDEDDE